jgi:hypothetical protein
MKHARLLLLVTALLGTACQRDDAPAPIIGTSARPANPADPTQTFDPTGQTLLARGTFVSNVHTTSGGVRLYEKDGKRTLVFQDFKTDAGPDLRIYLSETTSVRNFIEIARLDASGNFFVPLPGPANPSQQRFVLIWCKAFSVLFGNAELK